MMVGGFQPGRPTEPTNLPNAVQ